MSPMTLLLLSMLWIRAAANTCHYPDFLQTEGNPNKRWMYHVHNQGARGALKHLYIVSFEGSVMSVEPDISIINQDDQIRPYDRQCEFSTADGFISTHQYADEDRNENALDDTPTKYLCIQFTQISEFVVLIRESAITTDTRNDSLCTEVLTTDYWPMVSFAVENADIQQHLPLPLVGGYQFSISSYEADNNGQISRQVICPMDVFAPSRLEIGCVPDSDMVFKISDSCDIPDLKMDHLQYVYSLANWTMFDHTFMVLKNIKSLNLWCLRVNVTTVVASNFQAELFLDVVCDPRDHLLLDSKFLQLNLQRISYDSLCHDISHQCVINEPDVCSATETANMCMEHCNRCTNFTLHAGHDTACNFSHHLQGAWVHTTRTVHEEFLVTPSKIYMVGADPLTCVITSRALDTRYPLMYLGNNGCFPRFTCIDFISKSPGVVVYKIGWSSYWPADVIDTEDPYDIFCDDDKFEGRYNTLTNRYEEPLLHTLVHYGHSTNDSRASLCSIGDTNNTMMSFMKLPARHENDERCQGIITVPCDDPTVLRIESSDCISWPLVSTEYHCMASMESNNRRIVITVGNYEPETEFDQLDFRCWLFASNLNVLYVLPWAECDASAFDKLENTDDFSDAVETFTLNIIEAYSNSCIQTTSTQAGIQITVIVEEESTTWQFPNFVGVCSVMRPDLLLLLSTYAAIIIISHITVIYI